MKTKTAEEVLEHLFFTEYQPDYIPFIRGYVKDIFGYSVLVIRRGDNGRTFEDFLSWLYDVKKGDNEPYSRWANPTITVAASVTPKKEMSEVSKSTVLSLEEIISFLKEEESLPLHLVKVKSTLELCIDAIKNEGFC